MSRFLRTLAALMLAALFLTSPVAAAPSPAGAESVWSTAWEWLLDILPGWPPGDRPLPSSGTTGDAGVGIDPDGVVVTGAQIERNRGGRQSR